MSLYDNDPRVIAHPDGDFTVKTATGDVAVQHSTRDRDDLGWCVFSPAYAAASNSLFGYPSADAAIAVVLSAPEPADR